MLPFPQEKTVYVLILLCSLQCWVTGQEPAVTLRVGGFSVTFLEDQFRTFYGCMCSFQDIAMAYSTDASQDSGSVSSPRCTGGPDPSLISAPVYQCQNNAIFGNSGVIRCALQYNSTDSSERCVTIKSFRLKRSGCESSCKTLVWFSDGGSITFNTSLLSNLVVCEAPFSCISTTLTPESTTSLPMTTSLQTTTKTTSFSTTPRTDATKTSLTSTPRPEHSTYLSTKSSPSTLPLTVFSTTTDNNNNMTVAGISSNDDEDDDNTGVIAGVVVTALVIIIVVVIGVVWWKRRKKQGNKEPENPYVNTSTSLGLTDTKPSAEPSSDEHQRFSETAETSPREQSLTTQGSSPQATYSQLQIRHSVASNHAYEHFTTNPYKNCISDTASCNTKAVTSGTPDDTAAYLNVPNSTLNITPANSNISDSTPNSTHSLNNFISSSASDGSYVYPDVAIINATSNTNAVSSDAPDDIAVDTNVRSSNSNSTPAYSNVPDSTPNSTQYVNNFRSSSTSDGPYVYPDEDITNATSNTTAVNPGVPKDTNAYNNVSNSPANNTPAYSNLPVSTSNSTPAYSNIPNSTSNSTLAYSNIPNSTSNSTPAYSNIPNSTPNSTNVYNVIPSLTSDDAPTTSQAYSNTQGDSNISIIGKSETDGVYSETDTPYSTVTEDYENLNQGAAANHATEQKSQCRIL